MTLLKHVWIAGSPGALVARCRIAISLVLVALLPLVALAEIREVEESKGPQTGEAAQELGLAEALDRVQESYGALVVVYRGGADFESSGDDLPGRWKEYGQKRSFRRVLEALTVARVRDSELDSRYPGTPPPAEESEETARRRSRSGERTPRHDRIREGEEEDSLNALDELTVARVLGITRRRPALILVDFRERVVHRYVDDLPPRSTLLAQLKKHEALNRQAANLARRVEKVLESSRYAFKVGDSRTAVVKLLPLLEPKTLRRCDPVTRANVRELEKTYRDASRKVFDRAADLEGDHKYAEAMTILEGVARDYPFVEVLRESNQRRGEIYRKSQYGL